MHDFNSKQKLSQSISYSLSILFCLHSNYRPTSAKGLTSAVEQQNIAKSKNTSTTRKSSSPTATSGGSVASVNCDDDEIYGFTSANFGLLYNFLLFIFKMV
jgi:predicted nucleic acid binding AN1-type Zn finger protein